MAILLCWHRFQNNVTAKVQNL
ncbi:hypothetical protein NVIE_1714 [Nitrososphaera viennensis EN76]|uniref:Uncharacterized protein n=1 Tax=Nitrososphaera viennensis EN76 TaxID=926571 RepID=A0A060HKE1_9ARCH|nr:hypothetical protein NVIE_1714 [Nitrososphaera viennensis EN76]